MAYNSTLVASKRSSARCRGPRRQCRTVQAQSAITCKQDTACKCYSSLRVPALAVGGPASLMADCIVTMVLGFGGGGERRREARLSLAIKYGNLC